METMIGTHHYVYLPKKGFVGQIAERKLKEGLIAVGPPSIKVGERLVIRDKRYHIVRKG